MTTSKNQLYTGKPKIFLAKHLVFPLLVGLFLILLSRTTLSWQVGAAFLLYGGMALFFFVFSYATYELKDNLLLSRSLFGSIKTIDLSTVHETSVGNFIGLWRMLDFIHLKQKINGISHSHLLRMSTYDGETWNSLYEAILLRTKNRSKRN